MVGRIDIGIEDGSHTRNHTRRIGGQQDAPVSGCPIPLVIGGEAGRSKVLRADESHPVIDQDDLGMNIRVAVVDVGRAIIDHKQDLGTGRG